jgi:glycosyltransferase involved in cell wall biosynthesis
VKSAFREAAPQVLRLKMTKALYPAEMLKRFDDVRKSVGPYEMRKYIVDHAHVLLPNSHIEYQFLQKVFTTRNDYVAVPNAVNPSIMECSGETFQKQFGLSGFVLCVAAVQVRKNQFRLIQAAKDLGVELVLVGPEEPLYASQCRKVANGRVHFLGELRGDALIGAFKAAKVHALVSFYETPGLTSLEAALNDNVLVASDRGCTAEYFQKDAFYCDPNSVQSIRNAIERALSADPSQGLKERILKEYTWDRTAEVTIQGYEKAIFKARN